MSSPSGEGDGSGSGSQGGSRANTGLLAVAVVLTLALVGGAVYFASRIAKERGQAAQNTSASGLAVGGNAASIGNAAGAMSEAQAMIRAGNFAEAAKRLQTLIDAQQDDQSVRVAMAQALLGLKQPKDAYAQYEAALAMMGAEASPKADASGKVVRNPAAAQLHFEAGTCATAAGLGERAVEHYQAAQMLDASEAKYPMYLGMVQARLGDDSAAVASLIRATKLKPDLAEAWGTLAEIELRRNNSGLALQHVQRARELQANVVRWRVVEARCLNRTGEAEKALAVLSGLDDAARRDKNVLTVMGESYGLLKRVNEAATMYADAARANPSDSELNYQAAIWMERAGKSADAKRFAEIAASLGHEGARSLVEKFAGVTP